MTDEPVTPTCMAVVAGVLNGDDTITPEYCDAPATVMAFEKFYCVDHMPDDVKAMMRIGASVTPARETPPDVPRTAGE